MGRRYGSRPCKFCGAPIVWAKTDRGRWMPLDAEPVTGALLALVELEEERDLQVRVWGSSPDGLRYRPHFKTCPDVKDWRR